MPNLKISQLPEATPTVLQNTDLIPFARGNNTVRLRGDQITATILGNIPTDLTNLTTKVNTLSARDTDTIDLSFVSTTTLNTLSAFVRDSSVAPGKLTTGRPFWDSSGNVGIKTDAPVNNLHILEPGQNVGYYEVARFVISNNPTGTNFTRLLFGQVNSTRMFIEVADQTNTKGDLLLNPYGGNVGIGLLDAAAPLHVSGTQIIEANTSSDAALRITQIGSGPVLLVQDSANVDLTPFVIDSEGRVGIGATSTGPKVLIQGNTVNDSSSELRIAGTSGWVDLHNSLRAGDWNNITSETDKAIIFSDGAADTGNFVIAPWSSSTFGIRIVGSTGRVGINTNDPQSTLDVNGQATVNYLTVRPQDSNIEGGEIRLLGAGTIPSIAIDNYDGHIRFFGLGSGKQLQVLGGAVYVDSVTAPNYFAGNIGINAVTPSARLHIRETVTNVNPRVFLSTSQNTQIMYSTDREGIAGWSFGQDATDSNKFKIANRFNNLQDNTRLTIDNTGRVGIGTTTPGHELDVSGTVRARNFVITNNDSDASIEVGGASNVYIDLKRPASDDYDLRIGTADGVTSFIDTASNFEIRPAGGNRLFVRSDMSITGADLNISLAGGARGAGGRAVVHGVNNTLVLNFAGDFTGGTQIDSNLFISGTNRIGIGTSTPGARLDIVNSAGTADIRMIGTRIGTWQSNTVFFGDNERPDRYFMGTRGTNDTFLHGGVQDGAVGGWKFYYFSNENNVNAFPVILGAYPAGLNSPNLRVGIKDDTIYINENNNVGIGTTSPVRRLDVAGHIRSTEAPIINNVAPTIYFQDTDHRSAMIHVNGNVFHVLRGTGNNSLDWGTWANGSWPLAINLDQGDTFVGGNLFIQGTTANNGASLIGIRGLAGQFRFINFTTANSNRTSVTSRFDAGITDDPESGSDSGSNYFIHRFSDNGTYLGRPLQIIRSTGNVEFQNSIHVSTLNTTGAGIRLADDGDIVDLNDGYCSMRFSLGVRIYSANRSGTPTITLSNTGDITTRSNIFISQTSGWGVLYVEGQHNSRAGIHVGGDPNANELRIGRYSRSTGGWEANPFILNLGNGNFNASGAIYGQGQVAAGGNLVAYGGACTLRGWGGNDNSGLVIFGNSGSRYLYFDSGNYILHGQTGFYSYGIHEVSSHVVSNDVFNGGVAIKEVGNVGATQSDTSYSPALTFHWGARTASKIRMDSNGHYYFQAQGGNPWLYRDITANSFWGTGNLILNNAAPTIYFRDTDSRSAMIHCNQNLLYILRGDGNDSLNWQVLPNGRWPFYINLDNGRSDFGNNIFVEDKMVLTEFASLIARPGYLRLNNGLIIQWGLVDLNAAAYWSGGNAIRTISFPIAFPNNVFTVSSTFRQDPNSGADWPSINQDKAAQWRALTLTSVELIAQGMSGSGTNLLGSFIAYIAIGN
jgi:hypothetical protein